MRCSQLGEYHWKPTKQKQNAHTHLGSFVVAAIDRKHRTDRGIQTTIHEKPIAEDKAEEEEGAAELLVECVQF